MHSVSAGRAHPHFWPITLTILLALASTASLARAQQRTDGGVPAPPPIPPALASAPSAGLPIPVRATGILHTGVIASNGVDSFAYPTAVAVTAAANPALLSAPDDPFLSFQVQQSRAGLIIGEGTPVKAQLEVDFVHFDTSSPTVQASPRLRIANIEWTPSVGQRVFLGQSWDLYAPINSHSFNLVGTLFNAGNSGFMRHQLGWIGRFGALELAVAAGLQGANAGPTLNNIERAATPTGSVRVGYYVSPTSWFGISGIGSSLRFTSDTQEERRPALGGAAFGDFTFGVLNLRAELYVAQNLGNMGSLTLGTGRFGQSVADAGGFVSAKATLGAHTLSAMFGIAAALTPSSVVPGYTPSTDNMGVTNAASASPSSGPGIDRNLAAHVAYAFSPVHGLQIFIEPFLYATRYHLAANDLAQNMKPDRLALGAELGMLYTF